MKHKRAELIHYFADHGSLEMRRSNRAGNWTDWWVVNDLALIDSDSCEFRIPEGYVEDIHSEIKEIYSTNPELILQYQERNGEWVTYIESRNIDIDDVFFLEDNYRLIQEPEVVFLSEGIGYGNTKDSSS